MTAFRLALLELRRFIGQPVRRFALAVLVALPMMCAGLYLWSHWDPAGRSGEIPVAVVNEDEGAEFDGRRLKAGAEFTAQLAATSSLAWNFVSASEAAEGMKSGDYYFAIVVPPEFSASLADLAAADPRRAHISVELDDSNGYVAGVMADSVRAELQQQVDTAAYVTFAKSMFGDLAGLDGRMVESATYAMSLANDASVVSDEATNLGVGLTDLEGDAADLVDGIGQLNGAFPSAGSRLVIHWPNIQSGSQAAADLTDGLSESLADAYGKLCADGSDAAGCDDLNTAMSDADEVIGSVADVNAAVQDLSNDDLALAGDQMQELSDAATLLSQDLSEAADTSTQLSEAAGDLGVGSADLAIRLDGTAAAMPSSDPAQNAADADILASPVSIEDDSANPVGMNGKGMTPFVFAIALWVFALGAYLLLRPANPRALAGRVSAVTVAVGGWLPAVVLGAAGAVLMYLVVDIGLGLDAVRPLATLAVAITGVAVFCAIAQLLRFAFGAIGDALTLGLVLLQIAAAGGAYPVEAAPGLFQLFHPLLPMTYFVDALRISVHGGDVGRLWSDVAVLAGFGLVAVAASTLVAMRRRRLTLSQLHSAMRP